MTVTRITDEVAIKPIEIFLRSEYQLPPEQRSLPATTFFSVLQQNAEREGKEFGIREFATHFEDALYMTFRDGTYWAFHVHYDVDRGIYILERVSPIEPALSISLVPKFVPGL